MAPSSYAPYREIQGDLTAMYAVFSSGRSYFYCMTDQILCSYGQLFF